MSEIRELRDHSQPCGHKEASLLFDVDAWVCDRWDCPGGKEIVLTKVMAEWEGDMAVIRVDPGGEYWIDLERVEVEEV